MNYLETQIGRLIKYINDNDGGFGWKNYPERTFTGQFKNGEPFDYCIFTNNKKMVFDTKETDKQKWVILPKDKKQAVNLFKCHKTGVESFFLIYFITESKLVKIDITKFFDILTTRKYVTINDCVEFDYKELIKK